MKRFVLVLALPTLFALALQAQQPAGSMVATPGPLTQLSVVVDDNDGKPVKGLTAQDFTVIDNKHADPIVSFLAVDPSVKQDPPTKIILVLDVVNSTPQTMVFMQQQVRAYLSKAGAVLPQPVSIVYFADTGFAPRPGASGSTSPATPGDKKSYLRVLGPSTDAKALIASVDEAGVMLPNAGHAGALGAEERIPLSLRTIYSIVANEAQNSGRKAIIWISPGWPLMNGQDPKAQQMLFNSVVAFSTALQQSQVTLYTVDPAGVSNTGGNVFRTSTVSVQMAGSQGGGGFAVHESPQAPTDSTHLYEAYLKGVSSPKQAKFDHMALQVLSIKSGGQVFNQQNDLLRQITQCIADANSYYLLSIPTPKAQGKDEYHDIEIRLSKHGFKTHAITGLYVQP